MRLHATLPLALAGATLLTAPAARAQRTRVYAAPTPPPMARGWAELDGNDEPRAALGVSTGGSASARDTLGLLVTTVMAGSPAEKAGLEEGNRLASVNGVSLRVAAADVGDWEVSNAMSRRLTRELGKVKPGDDVELRVYAAGQTRTVKVKTASSDSLFRRRRVDRDEEDDRASLGLGVVSSDSRRDTLGVLVMWLNDSGPAARAGIEEGNRIASIGGVDLRVAREDAGDEFIAGAKVRRLQREVAALKPGADVELRVYSGGQTRTVQLKAARASDLPRERHRIMITGDGAEGGMMLPEMMRIEGARIGDELRRTIERVRGSTMQLRDRFRDGMIMAPGSAWHDDDEDMLMNAAPAPMPSTATPAPAMVRVRAPVRSASFTTVGDGAGIGFGDGFGAGFAMAEDAGGVLSLDGLQLVPVSAELATYLGRGSEDGALVTHAPGWAAGQLAAGDVLLAVDGRPVRDGAREGGISVSLDRSRATSVLLLRDGARMTVTLPARR